MSRLRSLVALLALAPSVSPLRADDPLPLGDEFAVNTTTTGNQGGPSVGMADDGRFVVGWSSGHDVHFRAYDAAGVAGSQTTLNQFTTNVQQLVDLDVNSNFDWAGAWRTDDQFGAGSNLDVIVRHTESGGDPQDEQLASEDSTPEPVAVRVTRHDDDTTTVLWLQGTTASFHRFDEVGEDLTEDLVAATDVDLAAAALDGVQDGSTVFAYLKQVGDDAETRVRLVAPDGSELVAEQQASAVPASEERSPAVGADLHQSFVVTWIDLAVAVEARLFAPDGTPTGGDLTIATLANTTANVQDVAVAPDGSFVVVWTAGADFNTRDIFAREYTRTGVPAGDAFPVNTTTPGDQEGPHAAIGSQHFVVVWQGPDADLDGVYGRRFERRVIFSDSFESNELHYWNPFQAN
jgi:hypothetical protein